jgi:hypothetical protein
MRSLLVPCDPMPSVRTRALANAMPLGYTKMRAPPLHANGQDHQRLWNRRRCSRSLSDSHSCLKGLGQSHALTRHQTQQWHPDRASQISLTMHPDNRPIELRRDGNIGNIQLGRPSVLAHAGVFRGRLSDCWMGGSGKNGRRRQAAASPSAERNDGVLHKGH